MRQNVFVPLIAVDVSLFLLQFIIIDSSESRADKTLTIKF